MYIEVLRVCVCISDSVPLEKDDDDVDDDDDAIYCITHVQTCVVCVSIQHISYTNENKLVFCLRPQNAAE